MSLLDGLLPGNRRVIINGVTAAPGRETLEIVAVGAAITDDPIRQRTRITFPAFPDDVSFGGRIAFSPSFSASSGGFSLGNGSVSGIFRQIDATTLELEVAFTVGSTTNFGSGFLQLAVPDLVPGFLLTGINTADTVGGQLSYSSLYISDSSTPANNRTGMVGWASSTSLLFLVAGAATPIAGTVPFTWATGDTIRFGVRFPAALSGA